MTTCPICRNGHLEEGLADTSMVHDGLVLVVRQVPAEICDNCGEKFFDETVTDRLLDIAEEAIAAGVQIDVRTYVAA